MARLPILALFLLLTPLILAHERHSIRSETLIPPFTTTLSADGSTTLPSSPDLPPVLRGLTLETCPSARGILIANSPILAVSGVATFTTRARKTVLSIRFFTPRISIRLTAPQNLADGELTFSGSAKEVFVRPFGLRVHVSERPVNESVAAVSEALAANPDGPRLIAVVDHSAAAASVGLSLPESSVIVFGNPMIGSRLWTQSPPIGVELPLEILVATSPLGVNYVAWSSSSLLRTRFGLEGEEVTAILGMIDGALARLAGVAANQTFEPASPDFDKGIIPEDDGLRTRKTKGDAVAAWERLLGALDKAEPVNVAYAIPHEVSAMNAGLPTQGLVNRVVVFGNAALGTGIMQRAFTAAIDLPVKMGVWTTEEGASRLFVGYTKPRWIGRRHKVDTPEMLMGALDGFADVALGA